MITIRQMPRYAICRPDGELDASNIESFRAALNAICHEPLAVIDLAAVTFIDSAALGAIIGATRKVDEAGGQLVIACNRPSLLKVFRMVQLDRIVAIEDDMDRALAALEDSVRPAG